MQEDFVAVLFAKYVNDTLVPVFIDLLREEIEKDQFDWDTVTVRKNGETVKSPRNAVDTGELRDSLDVEVEITDVSTVTMTAVYTADHAVQVYYGYVNNSGQLKLGRDWVTPAVERLVAGEIANDRQSQI